MTQTGLQALTGAIGEALNAFGGLRQTRLLYPVAQGETTVIVEHSFDWPLTDGRIAIDGVTYHYTANAGNSGTLSGLYVIVGGEQLAGTQMAHREGAPVVDTSQTYSALDLIRQAMLVNYAQGDDLSALGRNLGVLRAPYLKSDDQFRAIIKALSYNPKGTIYGLTLALDAIVGAGNYTLTEDLVNQPCQVTLTIPGSVFLDAFAEGKTYLTGPTYTPATSGGLLPVLPQAVGQTYARVGSITLSDENFVTSTRTALPSADTQALYLGGPNNPVWTWSGNTSESASNSVGAYGLAMNTTTTNYYYHVAPIQTSSVAKFSVLANVVAPTTGEAAFMSMSDSAHCFVVTAITVSGVPTLRFRDGYSGGTLMGSIALPSGYNEIAISKTRTTIYILLNGLKVISALYSAFTYADTSTKCAFGALYNGGVTPALGLVVRQAAVSSHTTTDYWSATGSNGTVNTSAANTIVTSGFSAQSGDAGKQFRITGSAVANSQGGNNNGVFIVQPATTGTSWVVQAATVAGAQTSNVYPLRITVNNTTSCFTFPDDLGKSLTIENSALGNGGTFKILRLYDPNTLVNLSTFATKLTAYTNVCEVQTTGFVAESGLNVHLKPNFATESNLSYELSDAGSVSMSGTNLTATPRQTLPIASAGTGLSAAPYTFQVIVDSVLSGQVLPTSVVANFLTSVGPPPTYTYWPFYVIDPYNVIELYVNQIVAAGVAVNFVFT